MAGGMGNCGKKLSSVFSKRDSPSSKIGHAIACPQCGRDFPSSTTFATVAIEFYILLSKSKINFSFVVLFQSCICTLINVL